MAGDFGKANIGHLRLQTAPQAAAQSIRESVISGELRGGDRIVEQKWAARLGIGQPTLREALNELTRQGLLRRLPQRGTYVARLSPEDYRLIQEVRIPLEAIAVGKAAELLTPAAEEELTTLVAAMSGTSMTAVDVKNFHDCDVAFHRKIWDLAGNAYLRDTLEVVTFRLFVFSVVDRWPGNPKAISERLAAVQQHLGILEGLRSRNRHVARQAFVQQTVQYWKTQYGLDMSEEEPAVNPPTTARPLAEKNDEITQKEESSP
jgi:DNA-binding GntR family transcriptional regulator